MKKIPFYALVVIITFGIGVLVFHLRKERLIEYYGTVSPIGTSLEKAYQPLLGSLGSYLDGESVDPDTLATDLAIAKAVIQQQHTAFSSISVPGETQARQLHAAVVTYLQHSRVIEEMFTQATAYMIAHNPGNATDIETLKEYFEDALEKDGKLYEALGDAQNSMVQDLSIQQ